MKTTLTTLLMTSALLASALNAAAIAQTQPPENQTVIYGGEPIDSDGIDVGSWGGGSADDHDGDAFTTAGHTVEIDTAGLYQGGSITFETPVSLGNLKSDPNRYLQIIFSAQNSTQYPPASFQPAPATGGYRGGPGGPPGGSYRPAGYGGAPTEGNMLSNGDYHLHFVDQSFQIAQAPGAGTGLPPVETIRGRPPIGYRPGGPPGMSYGGPMGGPQAPAVVPDETTELPNVAINQIHVIFVFEDGSEAEMLRPITLSIGDDTTWLRAGIPLTAIPLTGPEASNAVLKQILIGTDVPAVLDIGEIRLLDDTTPITADAGTPETVPAGSSVTLVGTGEGGASALKYEWDFDDASNGFIPEAEGVSATHTFNTPGDYTVTLRVSDVDGIKQPATATVVVHVNDQSALPSGGAPGMPPNQSQNGLGTGMPPQE